MGNRDLARSTLEEFLKAFPGNTRLKAKLDSIPPKP